MGFQLAEAPFTPPEVFTHFLDNSGKFQQFSVVSQKLFRSVTGGFKGVPAEMEIYSLWSNSRVKERYKAYS